MYLGNKSVITVLVRSNFDRDYFFSKIFTASRSSYQAPAKILSLGRGGETKTRAFTRFGTTLSPSLTCTNTAHSHTPPLSLALYSYALTCSSVASKCAQRLNICTAVKYIVTNKSDSTRF